MAIKQVYDIGVDVYQYNVYNNTHIQEYILQEVPAMKACAQEGTGYAFELNFVTESSCGNRVPVVDLLDTWMNIFHRDYLISQPLED